MAKLYFKVGSDWQEVVRLRSEIAKLKQELKSMDGTQSPAAFKTLNAQLAASTQRMDELVVNAAKAGAVMEGDFKKKIFDASQAVDGFTEKIIAQKTVVKNVEADVRRLGEDYRSALKNSPSSANGKLAEYNASRKALDEEKAALFGLTQEQANARLSVKKLRDEYALYKNDAKDVAEANNGIAISWKKGLAVIGGVSVLKALGSELIRVRGEFQSADTAIQTLLGNKEEADALMAQVREYAKISPLEFSDVTAATQMMLGFNIEAEKVPRFISAIGDVSMGESQKFNSLTLAFSQMSATGKLMGQDLNQMINAGFNPLQIMSEKTGKSIATLKDEMSKGAISAEMVQQAFIDATSAGGKFYNMSENASKTINGQLSMMQDAMDAVFNEMGTKGESVIMSGIQVTTSLIENYETVGKVLVGLVTTYGAYRTAVMLTTIATGKHTIAEIALTNARVLARKAQMALNASMLTNPYVALAVAVVGLGAAMWAFRDSTTAAEKATRMYDEALDKQQKKQDEYKAKIDSLIKAIDDNNTSEGERLQAFEALKAEYPTVLNNLLTEAEYLKDVLKYKKLIADEDNKRVRQDDADLLLQEESKLEQLKLGIDKLKAIYGNDETHLKIKPSIDAYNAQLEVVNKQKSKVASHDATSFLGNIKDMKDGDIASVIDGINNSLKALGKSGDDAIAVVSELGGEFSKSQLSSIKNALETEQKSRSGDKKTGEEWLSSYKKIYEDAEKAYNDFLNSKQVMSEAERDKELARLKELRDTAKTTYESKGGSTSSDSKQQKESEKQKKEQEKLAEELLSLRHQNQQDEITLMREGTDKKLKQIDLDYKKEIAAIKKQETEWSKAQGGKLTQEQSVEISARYANAEDKRDKNIVDTTKEQLQAEQQALNEYLEKYGTFQQQKYAIAQEYAEKIRKAQEENGVDSAQVKLLQKEQLEKTSAIDTAAIKANIDWATVFGEFGGMFNDMIKPALEEAKKYIKTDEFKNSDQASQKSLIDAINQMEKSLGGAGGLNFEALGQEMEIYQSSLRVLNDAKREETDAINRLNEAQEEYNKAVKEGTDEEKKAAKEAFEIAQQNANAASENVKAQEGVVKQNQQNLSNTATNLRANMDNVTDGLSKLASGGLKNAYDGLIQAGKGMGGAIGKVADSLEDVPIVGWIVSIIDVLKDGLSNLVGGLLDAVLNAVSGILSDVLSDDLFVTIGESLISGIGNIFDAISFGGFSSLFGANGNAKEVNELVDKLTDSNKYLITAIDKLTGEMEKSGGAKATSLYTDAYEKERQKIENDRRMLEAKMGYNASHHSNNYYIDKAFNSDDWKKASDYIGKTLQSAGDLWKLSPEDLARLQELPDIWEKINKGKYDQSEWLDTYVDDAERLQELTTKWQETMTQVSFDSFYSSFLDTLMDMGSSSKDFADDFEEYLKKSILNSMLADNFQDDIKKLYESWSDAYKGDNEITEDEAKILRDKQQKITEAMLAERDKLAEIFGWTKEDTEESVENYEDFASQMQGTLTSLELTAKDVSDNIYDYFRQAMINALYEKEYKSKMEELYKIFEGLSADGLSESDMAQLNSQINEYIDQMMKGVEDVNSLFADKLKDNEGLQSFVDNVKSAMSSIEATAEDVTDNIFEYIRQQMVEKMFADTFQPQIEEFYKKVQEAMSDGDITDSERDALRTEAEKLANDIVAAKDILSDTLGITSKNLQKELEEEFKSFSDGILNSLYNAEVTAESVAKDIAESMRKELIEAMYIEQYEPRIKAIWEKWKEYSADGLVTDEERANIRNDIDELGKEVADAAKEISDAWTDSGEDVKKAFESFSDSIKNVLYDAEATAEDVANNIYQYMRNALVDSMFTAQLKPQIQAWYDKYTEFIADGAIDTAERKTLDEMIAEIQKAGVDIVDAANALFPSLDTGAIKRAEEAAQEAENARNEAEQEWESFSDDILNSLYDIEATAEDISDDMGEYMRKALIKAMYVNNFKPQMQKWYNEWQKAMGDDNLTSEEKQTLDAMKQTMVDDMKKEVDAINQFFGTMYSQQASSKGFEAMSQDTGEELNGRFTALQVAGEEIKNQAVQQTGLLSSINNKLSLLNLRSEDIPALRSGNFNIADRTREVIASGYQSQINVVFPTDDIRTLTDKVSNMERIVDELRTFQIEKFTDVVEGVTKISKNTPQMNDKLDRINENIKRAL